MHEHLSFDIEEQRKVEKVISSLLFKDNSQSKEEAFDPSKIPGFERTHYKSSFYSSGQRQLVRCIYRSHQYSISTETNIEVSTSQILHTSLVLIDRGVAVHRNILTLGLSVYPTHNSIMRIFGILQELGVMKYFKEPYETIHS